MELGTNARPWMSWIRWLLSSREPCSFASQRFMAGAAASLTELDDEALFARIASGDDCAFAEFYDRHAALWFSVSRQILVDEAEAEDVLQEACVLIWERAPSYNRSLGKPLAWAVTVVRNKAIDRFRAGQRKADVFTSLPEGSQDTLESSVGGGVLAFGLEDAGLVRQALATLARDQRQPIELAFFGGLTQSEIAERLGQPLGTIKARIRRGMLHMRNALEGAL